MDFSVLNKLEKTLKEAADLLDKKYATQRQRIAFSEFIEHREYALALESLIELADESEERFSLLYWNYLLQAAEIMKLTDMQSLIRDRITLFYYEKAAGFTLNNPEVEAELCFLTTAEGGRLSMVYSGYRCDFHYAGKYNGTMHQFVGNAVAEPGQTIVSLFVFAVPEAQAGRLFEGLDFELTEGARVVARGTILNVLRSEYRKV